MPPPALRLLKSIARRRLATAAAAAATPSSFQVFDRTTKRLQRDRAGLNPASKSTDYLKDEIASRLVDRLLDITRPLPLVLDLGAGACHIARRLAATAPTRISHLICTDVSHALLHRDATEPWNTTLNLTRLIVDEESHTPFPVTPASLDAVLSSMSLHWTNDLPLTLTHIERALQPDAPFLAAMPGGDTLYELRGALQLAESERRGGVSPRVSPLIDVRDVAALLQRAGFVLVTVDVDDVVVDYPDVFALVADLGWMGEGNAVRGRVKGPLGRDVLVAAQAVYSALYGNEDGTLPATFRIINMIGWKKGEGQPKPLPRGSGQISIKDVLEGGGGKKKQE
ncbi:hypothetical protein Q9L58_006913 [Maublancomyces gigas]|uniref:Methyltransferase type 11 domain-containing protein n=1 Tax=Discina gigas TaxID=1032678 RepID=A0ABR3GE39_9PEZI